MGVVVAEVAAAESNAKRREMKQRHSHASSDWAHRLLRRRLSHTDRFFPLLPGKWEANVFARRPSTVLWGYWKKMVRRTVRSRGTGARW